MLTVVVILQIKTGKTSVPTAMKTLLTSNWWPYHNSPPGTVPSYGGSNPLWDNVPRLLFLICTNKDVRSEDFDRWTRVNGRTGRPENFYCYLDERQAPDIWGREYYNLMLDIKGKS
jgi:hypothetical protein